MSVGPALREAMRAAFTYCLVDVAWLVVVDVIESVVYKSMVQGNAA